MAWEGAIYGMLFVRGGAAMPAYGRPAAASDIRGLAWSERTFMNNLHRDWWHSPRSWGTRLWGLTMKSEERIDHATLGFADPLSGGPYKLRSV